MCKLLAFYISLGPNITYLDVEIEAVNISLKQLFSHIILQ